ncbi:rubrerythrin family protein [Niastella vici]|uniref:Rubrerythrin family protein n=1 Tax=Niastella vici TaxID=1703345 RepID=A0A1V9FMX8_9BACT|nr:ferritin-like domain-containing protein [Niastella vici]OQP59709.1 rubrerythrin family protein [Niastella vici]
MDSNSRGTKNSMLQDFFVTCLQELYWSETHLVEMLNTMSIAATTPQLKEAFIVHKEETEKQKKRLEEVFTLMGLPPQAERCAGLQGLFDEGWQVIDETEAGSAQRDVALIIAAQKVEHYEIASYGSLITLAKTMGQKEVANILTPTLKEEKNADNALTEIAEAGINIDASRERLNV